MELKNAVFPPLQVRFGKARWDRRSSTQLTWPKKLAEWSALGKGPPSHMPLISSAWGRMVCNTSACPLMLAAVNMVLWTFLLWLRKIWQHSKLPLNAAR